MSTIPASTALRATGRLRGLAGAPARTRASLDPPRLVALGLLALMLYAAFDHGAVGTAPSARVEVLVCLLAALGAGVWLLRRESLSLPLTRAAFAGLALMALFALWSGISLAWSVAPDGTWLELNRVTSYVLVLAIALGLGAAAGGSLVDLLADGLLFVTGLVTLYAIAQKLVPELHLGSLIDLNQAGPIPRLQEPLGYWNALALFIALGLPVALLRALDRSRGMRTRIACLGSAQVMLVTIGLTLSRGGLLALVLALVIVAPLTGAGLRVLMWSLMVVVAALPPLALGLSLHALNTTGTSLSSRAGAGAVLAALLIVSLAGLAAGSRALARLEQRTQLQGEARYRVHVVLGGLAFGVLLAVVLALSLSSRGLGGQISHAWSSFTANPSGSIYDPQHLLSQDSEHRWVWWKEAAGAFSDRPLAGWGSGSFPVVHLLFRRDRLSVNEPHSLPLQFLSETGVIGALLALGALVLLLLAAIRSVRARDPGPARLTAAALLVGALAFLIHTLYDWDWDIPGVAIPGLVLLGVLAGSLPRRRDRAPALPNLRPRTGMSGGLVALLSVVLLLLAIALSDTVPSLAAGDASAALVEAGAGGAASIQHALADAQLASDLDPLSDAGLRVEATIALRRRELPLARAYLQQAVRRDPTDVQAWQQLAEVDLLLGYLQDAANAAQRALALDPQGLASGQAVFLISQIEGLIGAPPRDSATAVPTTAVPGGRGGSRPGSRRPLSTPPTPLKPIVPGVNAPGTTTSAVISPITGPGSQQAPSGSTGGGRAGGSGTSGSRGGSSGSSGSRGSGGSGSSSGNSGQTSTQPSSTTTTPEPPVTNPTTTPTTTPTTPTVTTPTPPHKP